MLCNHISSYVMVLWPITFAVPRKDRERDLEMLFSGGLDGDYSTNVRFLVVGPTVSLIITIRITGILCVTLSFSNSRLLSVVYWFSFPRVYFASFGFLRPRLLSSSSCYTIPSALPLQFVNIVSVYRMR